MAVRGVPGPAVPFGAVRAHALQQAGSSLVGHLCPGVVPRDKRQRSQQEAPWMLRLQFPTEICRSSQNYSKRIPKKQSSSSLLKSIGFDWPSAWIFCVRKANFRHRDQTQCRLPLLDQRGEIARCSQADIAFEAMMHVSLTLTAKRCHPFPIEAPCASAAWETAHTPPLPTGGCYVLLLFLQRGSSQSRSCRDCQQLITLRGKDGSAYSEWSRDCFMMGAKYGYGQCPCKSAFQLTDCARSSVIWDTLESQRSLHNRGSTGLCCFAFYKVS